MMMAATRQALRIHPGDNVAVALGDIAAGAEVQIAGQGAPFVVRAAQPIPFAHKIALAAIAAGSDVLKYGVPIGFATKPIQAGEWVHMHNTMSHYAARKEGRK